MDCIHLRLPTNILIEVQVKIMYGYVCLVKLPTVYSANTLSRKNLEMDEVGEQKTNCQRKDFTFHHILAPLRQFLDFNMADLKSAAIP